MVNKKLDEFYRIMYDLPQKIHDDMLKTFYKLFLKNGDVVIDIGANTGLHTITLAQTVGIHGKVFAFEPVIEMVEVLKKEIRKHGLQDIISIHNLALFDKPGLINFTVYKQNPGTSCIISRPFYTDTNFEIREIKAESLDNFLSEESKINFIKIDAEGADFDILKGGARILVKHRPIVIFECGRDKNTPQKMYKYSKEDFFEYFKNLDYSLFDPIGIPFRLENWDILALNDLIAVPVERNQELQNMIIVASMKSMTKYLNEGLI